jgi:cytochrome d ubiquinol oxidase subunit II
VSTAWFVVLAGMLSVYCLLDGFDLGVGALHLLIAREEGERQMALASIGPVWNGNEVWLIATGGMLVVAFPRVYATGFSGFYLALMLTLWLLIGRGVAIEARHQIPHPMWRSFWDACFGLGSLLLTLLLGIAAGNLVRGLPIGADGTFEGTFSLLLNPFALLTGVLATTLLAWHGGNYLAFKTEGPLADRARAATRVLGPAAVLLAIAATLATFSLRAGVVGAFTRHPVTFVFPLLTVGGFATGIESRRRGRDGIAFAGSCAAVVGLIGSAAATMYPCLLISTIDPAYSLTVDNAASSHAALVAALAANAVGLLGVMGYGFYVYRVFRGKVRPSNEGSNHH